MKTIRFCKKCFEIYAGPEYPTVCVCGGAISKDVLQTEPVSVPVLDGKDICDKCGKHYDVGSWECGLVMGDVVVWRGNHKLCMECNDKLIAHLSVFFGESNV